MGKRPDRHQRTGKVKEISISEKHQEWYRRFMAGDRLVDIARDAGCDPSNVSKAVKRVESIASAEFFDEIRTYRARCTVRLEHLYHEAIREWERSKLPAVTEKIGQAASVETDEFDEAKPSFFIERTIKGQTASPALHAAARDTLQKLMDLHGIRFVETQPDDAEDDDIAGLTTVEQVELQIRKQQGDIKRLEEYRELVQQMEGGSSGSNQSAVATEREQILETPDEGETEGQAPD